MRKIIFKLALFFKSLFGTVLPRTGIPETVSSPLTIRKEEKKTLAHYFSVDREDEFDYTNTVADFSSNYSYLDDPKDEKFERISEQVGLIYEEDGKTPKNVAEIYDMTYEEYSEYKEKVLPLSRDRMITESDITNFLGHEELLEESLEELKEDKLDVIKRRIRKEKKSAAERRVANAIMKLKYNEG